MPSQDSPPLPAAPPLTAAAATGWRAARTVWVLDGRWPALVPVAFFLLAGALEPAATICAPDRPCPVSWGSALATYAVIAEAILLLARPRLVALVPPIVLTLLWYLPDGPQNDICRWTALLVHGLLAAVLIGAELGRRRARQQLDALMGPAVPYPWTVAGSPCPVDAPSRRPGRRILGWLLITLAVLLALVGLARQDEYDRRAAGATTVPGVVLSVDEAESTARIGYQPADTHQQRSVELDIPWSPLPEPGANLALLVDGEDWVQVARVPYNPTDWVLGGALLALLGTLLLGSARGSARSRQGFAAPGAPALSVLVQPDGKGDLLVKPVDAAAQGDPALWRLREQESYVWIGPDPDRPAWVHEGELYAEELAGADGDDGAGEDEPREDAAPVDRAVPPQAAAEVLEAANRPVRALLYGGPDGPHAQLLVRPPLLADDPAAGWVAAVCRERAVMPQHGGRRGRYLEDELAVAALTAQTVAEQPADGPPIPAQRWEMPLPLRLAAGPLVAVLLALAVQLVGTDSWWRGLLQPLLIGIPAFLGMAGALGWQAEVDAAGVAVVSALSSRRVPWQRVNAAAVHRHRLVVQLTDGRELQIGSRPARLLSRHLGGPYDPAAAAAAIGTAAQLPGRRPVAERRDSLASPQLLLNRLALTGYVVFVVAHFFG
ncbi:hypothetical protein [Kitasatospora sp. NPDC050543]|uniref:hypothetical protein n=1 Tax=Kitasatospora sp. NPDC050543 TaxID=3364054 RepID=UPI00379C633A